jgi:DNA primase
MQIEQNIIDEIIRRADIVEVIGKNLKLKRSGSNYFACCPFHEEKSPSFSVNSSKQFFHCFGCGESGNVITFMMKYNGLDFIEAVKSLASNYGVHIPQSTLKLSKAQVQEQKVHKANLTDTLKQTVQFYRNNLAHSSLAQHYLTNRGLSETMINQFLLGYVPNQPAALASVFTNYAQNQFLLDAGLVIKNDNGNLYDRFRDRIIFPIRNVRGEIIGFGGRIIAKGEPKYLNSPETALFNKSHELYGLYEAQRAIRDKNHVIVVEGYMDVIALAQFGITNVVATMGTAATEEHVKKLFRLCDDVYYCFDGDKAGRKAAWRALERSVPLVTDTKAVHFLFLPEEHDPDSFIRERGLAAFELQRSEHSLSMSSFLLNQLASEVNISSEEGRAKLISLAKPYIEQTKALALQVLLKKQLARMVELDPTVVESILNNRSRYAFYNSKWNKKQLALGEKRSLPALNTVELVLHSALNNIAWVINYRLPEDISSYNREIQELVLILDFICNTCTETDKVEINLIKQYIEFTSLNLDKIYAQEKGIKFSEEEFRQVLDQLFGLSKRKAIRIPKIPMKRVI